MYRVLLVDDEDIARIGLQTFVDWENAGFQVVSTAENGEEALSVLDQCRPDLIVSDLVMPGMDGIELVEKLKARNFPGEILIVSNYSDIDAVKKLMKLGIQDYLLKISYKKEEFEKVLAQVKQKLDARTTRAETENREQHNKRIKNYLLRLDQRSPFEEEEGWWQLICLRITDPNVTDAKLAKIPKSLPSILMQKKHGIQPPDCIYTADRELAVVWNGPALKPGELGDFARALQKMLSLYLSVASTIVYTENICGASGLPFALEECREAAQLCFYGDFCAEARKCRPLPVQKLYQPFAVANQFKSYLTREKIGQLEVEMKKLLSEMKRKAVRPPEAIDLITDVLLVMAAELCGRLNVELSTKRVRQLKACKNIGEAEKLICEAICALEKLTEEAEKEEKEKDFSQLVIEYIDRHISEHITLTNLAECFNMHPNYISTRFKAMTGTSLVTYINQKKMEKARDLLLTGEYRIKDVAQMVGIEDPFYFSRLFKRCFNIPPSQFEEQNQKSKEEEQTE